MKGRKQQCYLSFYNYKIPRAYKKYQKLYKFEKPLLAETNNFLLGHA